MSENIFSVRELQKEDIDLIINYWLNADPAFLQAMGVDLNKMPKRDEWEQMLTEQLSQSYKEKKSYCIIWQVNDKPIGHSNINKIIFGEEAYMHLHIWYADIRKKSLGTQLIKMTLPCFFEKYQLKKLYCEPYALNPAPNNILGKVGFEFVKEYINTPGWINFEQPVKLWIMSYDRFREITRAE